MTIRARGAITLTLVKDITSYVRYYLYQLSTLAAPDKPATLEPASPWTSEEPGYDGTEKTLYYCDRTCFSDGSFSWSDVCRSSSMDAWADLSDAVAGNGSDLQALMDEVQQNTASISQTHSAITSEVAQDYVKKSDAETLRQDLESKIVQTHDAIQLDFQQTTDQISQTVSDNQAALDEFIRFSGDTITLGIKDSAFSTTLTNEELAFNHDGTAVAWIDDEDLEITNATISHRLSLGHFDLVPRATGDLSLVWRE